MPGLKALRQLSKKFWANMLTLFFLQEPLLCVKHGHISYILEANSISPIKEKKE